MHRTLDSLIQEQAISQKTKHGTRVPVWLHEMKIFGAIFVAIFFGMIVFTNANLFMHALGINPIQHDGNSLALSRNGADTLAYKPLQGGNNTTNHYQETNMLAQDMHTILETKVASYGFDFNILPPVDRLVIDAIYMDVPLIALTNKSAGDFARGDFDDELRDGVVKYPTTPMPGEGGNTLIFGHTSQERREKNPYGTVFSQLPKLSYGDEIKVVWKGELYTYKVQETVIRRPKDVDAEFQKRQAKDKEYITLMGCYPLGTTKQRMMVIAERVYE